MPSLQPNRPITLSTYHGETTVVKNRSSRKLIVLVDSVEWPLEPGDNVVPNFVVPYAVRQHPIPGTQRVDGSVESFIGVAGITPDDQMGMLPPTAGKSKDLFDRTAKPLDPKCHETEELRSASALEGFSSRPQIERDMERNTALDVFQ